MRDPAEVGPRRGIGERDRGEPLAIEPAVGREDRGAEPGDELGERRLTGLDDLARELVGVDHGGAAVDQQPGDGGLPRGDPAGQSDHVNRHEASLPQPREAGVGLPRCPAAARCVLSSRPSSHRASPVVRNGARVAPRLDRHRGVRRLSPRRARGLAGDAARADARAVRRRGREPRCLGCHATGEAPAGPAIAVEVGCEACHGAGAAYAEPDVMRDRPVALALGLADTSTPKARAAVCAPCHRAPTRGAAFDPTAPVHPVAHAP